MTGLVRKASLLAVLGILATATVAGAGVPDPAQCVIPSFFDLVACKDGVVDSYGAFTVTVNDAGGNPMPGVAVEIVFASDLYIYSAIAGLTVNCTDNSVMAMTDASGVAYFTIPGATINTNGVAAGSGLGGAAIYANDIALGTATVAVYDENGAATTAGVEVTDLAAWLGDFAKVGTIGYKGRSDFNHNGAVEVVDLSTWLVRFASQNSSQNCGTLCP